MIDSCGWGVTSDGSRFSPNSGKITGRMFIEVINASREHSSIKVNEPLIEKSTDAGSSDDHVEVRHYKRLGGEIKGPYIV